MSNSNPLTPELIAKSAQQARQVLRKQLFSHGIPAIIAGQLVAFTAAWLLWDHANHTAQLLWIGYFTLITLLRLGFITVALKQQVLSKRHERLYCVGAFFAGIGWGTLGFFYTPDHSIQIQLFLLIVLMGMPMASMPSNAFRLNAYIAFASPIIACMFVWTLFLAPGTNAGFVVLVGAYSYLLFITAVNYSKNLMASAQQRFEINSLVGKLEETNTMLESSNTRLEKMAYLDPLTNLANRRSFQNDATMALQRIMKNQHGLALLLIDADRFKAVNDTHGHNAGDQLLIHMSNKIGATIRESDTLTRKSTGAARLGGDEFIVVLEGNLTAEQAIQTADRILDAIRFPLHFNGTQYLPSASIGIALAPEHSTDLDELLHLADKAMYQAKKDGGNGYALYNPTLDATRAHTGA
jgi:diguanylate cyclase (GGDEF)-like protein